jgi:hypothetical protein
MNQNEQQHPEALTNQHSSVGVVTIDDSKKLPNTTGETIFNYTDWFGIGWIANAGISVVATDYLTNKGGAYGFSKVVNAASNSPVFREGALKKPDEAMAGAEAWKKLGEAFQTSIGGAGGYNPENEDHAAAYNKKIEATFKALKEDAKAIKNGQAPEKLIGFAKEHGLDLDAKQIAR